jgi:formyltetrahydrofolate-dependent phosphoribosylglycinamide formyltransferase
MTARLIVFISGSGTNLQAILDAIKSERLDAEVGLVVSNRKAAYGLVRAEEAGIPTLYFPLKPYSDNGRGRDAYEADLLTQLQPYKPDLLVLAGWMHIFNAPFTSQYKNRIVNLHPALPGAFPGKNSIRETFEAYQRGEVTHGGCMIHYVVPELDAGPVIVQQVVPIMPNDTLETFEVRVHEAEHRIIVDAIRKVLSGQ